MGEEIAGRPRAPGKRRGWQERRPWALGGCVGVVLKKASVFCQEEVPGKVRSEGLRAWEGRGGWGLYHEEANMEGEPWVLEVGPPGISPKAV